jgi:hypothetical protein
MYQPKSQEFQGSFGQIACQRVQLLYQQVLHFIEKIQMNVNSQFNIHKLTLIPENANNN